MSDKMREAFKVAFRKAASEDVDYDEAVDRGLAAALTAQAEQHGGVSGWYCAHCQHGVDPVDVTFGEKHVYCGYPVTDCPAPPAPVVPDGWKLAMRQLVYYARTSGGTAGPDPILMEACEVCEKLLAAVPTVAAKGVNS